MHTKIRAQVSQFLLFSGTLAACGSPPESDGSVGSAEDVGEVQLLIQQAPADGKCLRLTVDNPLTQQKQVRTFTLTPGAASQLQIGSLPLGDLRFLGEVFNIACTSVTATSLFTWVSDLTSVTMLPDTTPTITLSLHKAGKVNLGVDFVSGATFEEVLIPDKAGKIAAAPDGSVVFTLPARNEIWRASTAFNATKIANVSAPGPVTVAADGTILVAAVSSGTGQVSSFTASGAAKSTRTFSVLGFSDIVIDASNTGWLMGVPSLFHITAPTSNAPVYQPILNPPPGVSSAQGLAVAANGRVRVLTTSNIYEYDGVDFSLTDNWPISSSGRDLVVAGDGTMWIVGGTSNIVVFKVNPNRTMEAVFSYPASVPVEFAIVSTAKGILVNNRKADESTVWLFPPGGALMQEIPLPGDAFVTAMAVANDGRVWAADGASGRLLIITLP
jgi:hypothetical protein